VSDAAALLAVAVDAARTAGELLAERVRDGAEQDVAAKSTPTDLVSEADLAAERAIRELLAQRRPDDGFLGEEGGPEEHGVSGLSWVVDPLDGTVNFLFGIPQWSVSVAVRDGSGTIAGAVYDPNRDELFTATREGGASLAGPAGEVELAGAARARRASGQGEAPAPSVPEPPAPAPSRPAGPPPSTPAPCWPRSARPGCSSSSWSTATCTCWCAATAGSAAW